MWIVESLPLRPRCVATAAITLRQALLIGFAQVLALVPGTSRSHSVSAKLSSPAIIDTPSRSSIAPASSTMVSA